MYIDYGKHKENDEEIIKKKIVEGILKMIEEMINDIQVHDK